MARAKKGDVFAPCKPKPAPAEGAAEGRYAVLVDQEGAPHFVNFGLDLTMHVSDRDEMEYERNRVMVGRKASDAPVKLVRVLDDGAHEAACEAARREERERAFAEVEAYAARVSKQYGEADPHSWSGGCSIAFAEIAEFARNEAGKGQAK